MNRFEETCKMLGEHEASLQLMEFLEDSGLTLYGVSVQPSKIKKLRHEMQRRFNINPEELQK